MWMLLSALTACLVLRYVAVVVFAYSCHGGHGFTIFVVVVVSIAIVFFYLLEWDGGMRLTVGLHYAQPSVARIFSHACFPIIFTQLHEVLTNILRTRGV